MGLATLIPELLLCIADYLDPVSAFNFAIARKSHWALCERHIAEHKRLLAENRSLDLRDAGRLVWTTLKEILHDPSLGWYVRELNIPSDRQVFWDPAASRIDDVQEELPEEDVALFSAATRKLKEFYPLKTSDLLPQRPEDQESDDVVAYIEHAIAKGYDGGIISLLVHYLPNLERLRVTDHEIGGDVFARLLEQVAVGYGDPARARNMPFQRLEAAAVAHWDTEFSCDCEWALHLSCIPSLRRFAALMMGDDLSDSFYSGEKLPNSNVKQLYFCASQIDLNALGRILMNIRGLEKFTYDSGGGIVSYTATTPKRIIKLLEKHHGHCLQELIILDSDHNDEGEDLSRISLRGFQKLRKFHCNWEILRPGEGNDSDSDCSKDEEVEEESDEESVPQAEFNLEDVLPASLESLLLSPLSRAFDRESVMEQLAKAKESLPNFKDARIAEETDDGDEFIIAMQDASMDALLEGHGN